jgi:hypothetical protein
MEYLSTVQKLIIIVGVVAYASIFWLMHKIYKLQLKELFEGDDYGT